MSEKAGISDPRDCGGDVAAYALGALEPAEAEAFRAHLVNCAVCRDELAAFQHVVDVLPMSPPQHRAPKRLRRRVLGAVAREPKLELRGQRRSRTGRFAVRRNSQWSPRSGLHFLPWPRAVSVSRSALALGAIAVVAAVVVAVGGLGLGSSGTIKTRVYTAHVTGSGSAEITVTGGHAELIVHHFSPPPAGDIYQVWLTRPNQPPIPTSALFSVTAKGDGDVEVPGNLRGVNQVMVTAEPAGGTRVPTNPPVIRAELT